MVRFKKRKKDKTFPTHPGIQYPPFPDNNNNNNSKYDKTIYNYNTHPGIQYPPFPDNNNNNNSKYDKTIFNDYNKKLTQVSSILPSTFQPETLCKPSSAVCKLLSYLQVLLWLYFSRNILPLHHIFISRIVHKNAILGVFCLIFILFSGIITPPVNTPLTSGEHRLK